MSRHEGKFTGASEAPLEMAELLETMSARTAFTSRDRQDAIACYLSAGDGWRDALDAIGGAFAPEVQATELKSAKDE
ncbi:MAG TPA: hypothetical protein VM346_04540 [Sphingomicrobium sp.]|nr:hypothetical protein [Sphingomicrobium sp.]